MTRPPGSTIEEVVDGLIRADQALVALEVRAGKGGVFIPPPTTPPPPAHRIPWILIGAVFIFVGVFGFGGGWVFGIPGTPKLPTPGPVANATATARATPVVVITPPVTTAPSPTKAPTPTLIPAPTKAPTPTPKPTPRQVVLGKTDISGMKLVVNHQPFGDYPSALLFTLYWYGQDLSELALVMDGANSGNQTNIAFNPAAPGFENIPLGLTQFGPVQILSVVGVLPDGSEIDLTPHVIDFMGTDTFEVGPKNGQCWGSLC